MISSTWYLPIIRLDLLLEIAFPSSSRPLAPSPACHTHQRPAFQTKLQAIRGDPTELEELRLQVMHGAGLLDLQADLPQSIDC